jgi:hypothetical protein
MTLPVQRSVPRPKRMLELVSTFSPFGLPLLREGHGPGRDRSFSIEYGKKLS